MTTAMPQLDAPRFEHGQANLIAGLRGHFTNANWAGIPAQWERFVSYGKIPGVMGPVHYGLCFNLPGGFDYLCGVQVAGVSGLPAEFSHASIPVQKYAVFAQHAHVSKLHETIDAIWRHWFPGSGHEIAPAVNGAPNFFERYGPGFNPVTGQGDIEVWIPVKS
ncbi:MAG TPA: GyrI-like domain-containing protein [Bryobacteraceae bacterium]|jgi:AraC family transcriptional regulator|nr:GyrI-like domain-containing protein [Bryobacteraceae bacterium]